MITHYIGVDVHLSTCTFCVVDSKGVEIDTATIVTNGRLLIDYVSSLKGRKQLTFEECSLSSWLFTILQRHVDDLIVCNPVDNRPYKKAKTDKLDARNLAHLLRGGFLKPVFHDGSPREKFRVLMSAYQDTVDDMTRLQNRLHGIQRREKTMATASQQHRADLRLIREQGLAQLEVLRTIKCAYIDRIKTWLKKFPEARLLISIPGIGDIHAAKIIAQVIEPRRFKDKHKFFSYCGLVRHQRISGDKRYGSTRIWGNRVLKDVYRMAAHSVLRGTNAFAIYYKHLRQQGISDQNARNAVARKIAAISLTLWRNKQLFNDTKVLAHLPI